MKFKFLKAAITGLIVSISSFANAGLIQADVINGDNSAFTLDVENYDLKWLDFGSISGSSYSDIDYYIGAGKQYEGWRIANQYEATELWEHLFFSKVETEYYNSNGDLIYSGGADAITDLLNSYRRTFGLSMIGSAGPYTRLHYQGWYLGDDETINSLLATIDQSMDTGRYANITSGDYQNPSPNRQVTHFNVLLVKGTERRAVPEPSTLVIFALGLMGLALRRFKKQ
jgi:hypothetical protein